MRRSPLLAIFLIVFVDLVSFGIVIPILPYYSKAFGASATALGWLMATYSIAQFLCSPFWGALSDRHGRRPVLLGTIAGGTISLAAAAIAPTFWMLILARLLAGVFGANISTASAYIADVTTEENRAKGMGIIGAGFGLGFIFGPAIGGVLSPYGYSVPILVAAGLSAFNCILVFLVLQEPPMDPSRREANRRRLSFDLLREAFALRATAWPILIFFVGTLAITQLEVSFGFYVLERFGYEARQAGMILAMMGLVMVAVQGGGIGKLAKKFGEAKLTIGGFALMAVSLIGAGFAGAPAWFIFTLIGVSLGNALVNPSLSSLLSKGAPPARRGAMLGVYQSAGSFARIVGPPLSGFCFDKLGPASPIFVSSVLMTCAAVGAKKLRRL